MLEPMGPRVEKLTRLAKHPDRAEVLITHIPDGWTWDRLRLVIQLALDSEVAQDLWAEVEEQRRKYYDSRRG